MEIVEKSLKKDMKVKKFNKEFQRLYINNL